MTDDESTADTSTGVTGTDASSSPGPVAESSTDLGAGEASISSPAHQDHSEQPRPGGADPELVGLVQLADAYGLEYRLLLTLAGQVVEGTLVSARSHATEVADLVQGEDPEETFRGTLAAQFRRRGEALASFGAGSQLGGLAEGEGADDLPTMPEVEFVHLREVTVSSSDHSLSLWRGRLADVVGWSLLPVDETPL